MRLPQAKLDQVLDRFHQVEARMGAASDGAEIVRLSKEHAEMKPVVDAVSALARARAEIADVPPWLRPGAEGIARIDTGDRRLYWILKRRIEDTIRLWMWW